MDIRTANALATEIRAAITALAWSGAHSEYPAIAHKHAAMALRLRTDFLDVWGAFASGVATPADRARLVQLARRARRA